MGLAKESVVQRAMVERILERMVMVMLDRQDGKGTRGCMLYRARREVDFGLEGELKVYKLKETFQASQDRSANTDIQD